MFLHIVQPHQAVFHIAVQLFVALFATQRTGKKLGEEKRYRQFAGVKRYRNERLGQPDVAEMLQAKVLSVVENNIKHAERLEELLLHTPLRCLGKLADKRQPTLLTCEEVNNDLGLPILQCPQNNCPSLGFHTRAKIRKIKQLYKKPI